MATSSDTGRLERADADLARELRAAIVKALHWSAEVDARHIDVTVSGSTVMLTGTVGSSMERESAGRAAARAGAGRVDNRIVVEPPDEEMIDAIDEIV